MNEETRPVGTLELSAGICDYRPRGECTLIEAVEAIDRAIRWCRERSIERLLIVGTGLRGVAIPSPVDRFVLVEEWAEAADGFVRVALVLHPEYIHPEKFGVRYAVDLGLMMDVHTDEARARAWLLGQTAPTMLRHY